MGKHYQQFSLEERSAIARLYKDGQSIRQIAAALDRPPSSVAREIKRNSTKTLGYRPDYAEILSRSRRWSGSKLSRNTALRKAVLGRLAIGWSPEQIAGRMAHEQQAVTISHESIYRFIYAEIARTKDYRWRHYLPRAKSKRSRGKRRYRSIQHIYARVPISERSKHVEQRQEPGHWESDLLHPTKHGAAILVHVERCSRFTLLAKHAGKHAAPISQQLRQWFSAMPENLRKTVTHDNGPEFFLHHQLHALGLKTFFCNPHSPWQKGTVENMNGRIRRFIPRGTNPNSFTEQDIKALAHKLNHTPRKCLAYKTPAEVFKQYLKPLHFNCESTCQPTRE